MLSVPLRSCCSGYMDPGASESLNSSQNALSSIGRSSRQCASSARRKSKRLSHRHVVNRYMHACGLSKAISQSYVVMTMHLVPVFKLITIWNALTFLNICMYNMSNLTMVETVCSHVLVCFSEWNQGKLVASLPRSPRKKTFVSPCACASAWARAAETL